MYERKSSTVLSEKKTLVFFWKTQKKYYGGPSDDNNLCFLELIIARWQSWKQIIYMLYMSQQPCQYSTTIFFALPRGVPFLNYFNSLRRALTKNPLENRMSKFLLVKKWWDFENRVFCVQHPCCFCCCFSRHVFPDFFISSHDRRPRKFGICVPYGHIILTFWLLPKNSREKKFPPPQFNIFFGFPLFFLTFPSS